MPSRSILVFALSAMVAVSAEAGSGERSTNRIQGKRAAAAQGNQRHAATAAERAERRAARAAKQATQVKKLAARGDRQAAKAQKLATRGARLAAKADEPTQPKDYSRDFQVPSGPDAPFGTTLLSESFDSGIPAGWAVVDNAGSGIVWTNLVGCGEAANWTGGAGDLACVSSDLAGPVAFDTELRTPVIDLSEFDAPATLTFNSNYQNFAALDFLEVDVSTNGASGPWTNLLSWNEDHGAFRALPGEAVNLDIASVVGEANVMFRFHYFDPNSFDWDWYAQVDDVVVEAQARVSLLEIPTASSYGLAGLALLLAGAGFVVIRRQH